MIISPDNYLLDEHGEYVWSEDRARKAWGRVHFEVPYILFAGNYKRIVLLVGLPASGKTTWLQTHDESDALFIDATFIERSWRTPFVKYAQKAKIPIDAVVFDTPFPVIQERNAKRPASRRPSEEKLQKWFDHLQANPPVEAEGFREVSFVRSLP